MKVNNPVTAYYSNKMKTQGYIYVPCVWEMLPPMIIGDFEPRKVIKSRYATKTIDSKFYSSIKIR